MALTEEKYLNGAGLANLLDGLHALYANKTKTEAEAVALATEKPGTVYLTTDTHAIVSGGEVYGRGHEMTPAFRLVADTSGQASWDTSYIYLVPTATAGQFTLYSHNSGSWVAVATQSLSIVISASGVTYDRTNTPNVGSGDAQTAIEYLGIAQASDFDLICTLHIGWNPLDAGASYPLNKTAFVYSAHLYEDNARKLTGSCADLYKTNTSMVYMPKFNVSAVTSTQSMFNGNTAVQYIPDLNFANATAATYMFSGAKAVKYIGNLSFAKATSAYQMFYNIKSSCILAGLTLTLATSLQQAFAAATGFTRIGDIYAPASTNWNQTFNGANKIVRIGNITMGAVTNLTNTFQYTDVLQRIDSIDMTNVATGVAAGTFNGAKALRHMEIIGLGTRETVTSHVFTGATYWGVNSTAQPGAKQSLLDSLLTNSYDRATAGYATCTIKLSTNTWNQYNSFTAEDKQAIAGKGYSITK